MKHFLNKSSRTLAAAAVATATSLIPLSASAQAENYPDKPIRMIVAYSPGGATDIVARMIGAKLQDRLGQPIVVDNKPGGGSNIGTAEAARAKPDGYTMLMGTIAQAINPAVYSKIPYQTLEDFDFVTLTMTSPSILVVNKDVPVNSVQELIEWAKANPGKLTMASSGPGGSPHMAAELLKLRTGIDYLHVPYKGASPAMNDVLSGVVMGGFKTATAAIPQIQSGNVKALAVAAPTRLEALPDLPTMAEAGIPDFNVASWNGIMVPKGTPKAIIDKLANETIEVLKDPEIVAQFEKRAAQPGGNSPAEFQAFMEKEMATWKEVAEKANVKIN